jgi:hypothetical protein
MSSNPSPRRAGTARTCRHGEGITYLYEVEGRKLAITRHYVGTAYPVNGNVHNPTQYFSWSTTIDGKPHLNLLPSRAQAYEHARAYVLNIPYHYDERRPGRCENVRAFWIVRDEMKANYQGRESK